MSQELLIKDTGVIARAELDTQISTAKAYPRNPKQAIDNAISLATMDEATAQSCFYCLPRKDKDGTKKEIRGASIRLAEIAASSWGNIHAATRIIENDGRHITAEAVCWDLESNVKIAVQNKISIRFGEKDGKGGYTANADMQTVLSNAASAKALRNAIFKVIPKALVDRVLEHAMNYSIGDQKTINAKVTDIVDKLVKMGIDKQKMLDYYECKTLADITPAIYKSLIGIGTAIKENQIKIDEVFMPEGVKAVENNNATDRLAALANAKDTVNKETGEVTKQKPEPTEDQLNFESVKGMLANAKNEDELFIAADLIVNVKDKVLNAELLEIYKNKLAGLKK